MIVYIGALSTVMITTDKPITILNQSRLSWLMQGCRAHAEGLDEKDNPHSPNEGEMFDWWLFGWTYAQLTMLERN